MSSWMHISAREYRQLITTCTCVRITDPHCMLIVTIVLSAQEPLINDTTQEGEGGDCLFRVLVQGVRKMSVSVTSFKNVPK